MSDFILSFAANLIFRYELLVLSLIALLLHVFFKLTIAVFFALLGIWFFVALFITLGLGMITKNIPESPKQENVNPYSKSTKDFSVLTNDKAKHSDMGN